MVRIGPHLYSGTLGIAIFFAALSRVQGNPRYSDESHLILSPLRRLFAQILSDPERAARIRFGIGGLSGLGSIIYSFVVLGRLLDATDLIHEAHNISSLVTAERIAADRVLDVTTGGAGTILALLALDRNLPGSISAGPHPLELAAHCAEHLMSLRISCGEDLRAWKTLPSYPPLTGFAHGAAGICYSLLRLYETTRQPALLEAARDGLAFEKRAYVPEAKNWRDLRFQDIRFMNSWCHGAPGITLSRLATLHMADDEEIRADIFNGLETTLNSTLGEFDHLCCGNTGRADVLLYAYGRLGNPALLRRAQEISSQVLDRARASSGQFRWMLGAEVMDPSFFAGAAGVGYFLLRLAQTQDLPCILLME